MKRVKLRNTDLELSSICYGAGNFGEKLDIEQAFCMLDAYVELGGNFIDTANVYCRWIDGLGNSSEQYIGRWLKERNAYNKVVIATKGAHYDFAEPEKSRVREDAIRKDLEDSLRTLGLDRIDFYWLHRDDESIDIKAVVDIMERLVKEGKIRYYGASNYKQYRMEEAVRYASEKGLRGFSAVSNQWSMATVNEGGNMNSDPSLVMMDDDYYQWHAETGMPIIPFSSGAHGFFDKLHRNSELSDEMKRAYMNDRNLRMYEALCNLSEKCGDSVYSLSLAWLINQPFQVFPAASVTKAEQLKDFARASEIILDKGFMESLQGRKEEGNYGLPDK